MRSVLFSAALAIALLSAPASAQSHRPSHRVPPPRRFPIGGTAPSGAHLKVPADLAGRLARWPAVEMPFRPHGLTPRQIQMIGKLVEAARQIDAIDWRQSDPYALTLAAQLKGSTAARDRQILRYFSINGGQYDLLDGLRSFINGEPAPAGRAFYPEGANPEATRQGLEAYVHAHPASRAELYSPYTLVRAMGSDLVGLPYRSAFRAPLLEAARDLREAAAFSDDAAFAEFLRARAEALLSDDYRASDRLWLALKQPQIDLILAPCLPQLDPVLGVKRSFAAAILLRNAEESRKLEIFQPYIAQIQQSLPLPEASRPALAPFTLEAVDSPLRAGALLHGYQTLAITLPDTFPGTSGSRKIFFPSMIDARFQRVILPLTRKLMDPSQSGLPAANGYLTMAVMQEIGRSLGPDTDRPGPGQVSIREALGPLYPALDQAKADAAGMYATAWLLDRGVLPREREQELYACYLAELLRALLPYSATQPNPQASPQASPQPGPQAAAALMEFNYLFAQSAIVPHAGTRSRGTARVVFALDFARLPAAISALNRELLEVEASGDPARAKQWLARYSTPPPALRNALETSQDVAVDIFPIFSWDMPIQ
jgi:hypothetical protein